MHQQQKVVVAMGGVNCPPPSSIHWDELPIGFKDSYVSSLATYSDHLFTAISSFYAANAMIEKSVRDNGDMLLSIDELETARSEAIHARDSLGTVHSLWDSIASGNEPLDFKEQMGLLNKASLSIETAIALIDLIDTTMPIQTQIWSEPILTESLVETIKVFALAMNWQVEFALQYSIQTTKV